MVRRELVRLRRVFERALLLSAGAGAGAVTVYACSSGDHVGEAADASASDGRAGADGVVPQDGASPVDAGDEEDASPFPPGCAPAPPVVYDAAADAPNCAFRVALPCGLPSFVTSISPVNCVMPLAACIEICTGIARPFLSCEVANGFGCDDDAQAFVAADGQAIVVECDKCTIAGRRPRGLRRARGGRRAGSLGAFFSTAAHLEAASIVAFRQLASDLDTLGAPRALSRAALRASEDERRHARAMARLARRHGDAPSPVRAAPHASPSLVALARDNAAEGCVRETLGAVLAAHQARHASDPTVARAMRAIARDEARHAALAWAVARWAEPQLDARERRSVIAARRRAIRHLRRALRVSPSPELRREVGLPSAETARRLFAHVGAELWNAPTPSDGG
ncbi:MAG TPA: hypothetical protein VGG39_13940 [Polyangiaceae bacterium]|jgi:rubrerythrin